MKTRRTNSNAVDTQFDEWAKAVAHGLTRRKTLQLIGGGFTGALVALRGRKAWAIPSTGTQGCGHVCAPLFNRRDQTNFEACTQACEDCKSCQGIPTMTSTQVLVCNNATPCRSAGSGLMCCSSGQNCCGGVCCNTDCCGGQCLPACTAGFQRDPSTCQCGCPSGTTLCGTQCVAPSQCCNGQVCLSPLVCCGGTACMTAAACLGI